MHARLRLPLVLSLLFLLGCGQSNSRSSQPPASTAQKLQVVATVLPMYWFTKAVAGEAAEVKLLIPPGTEVHEYQSTPADVQTVAQADVLVKNGLGLEEFLDNTVRSAQNTKLAEITASQGIEPIDKISPVLQPVPSSEHSDEHGEAHGEGNPHVWLDPVLAKQQVTVIRDRLSQLDPKNQTTYQANAAAYSQQLDRLDQQFQQQLKPYQNRTFITFHDAFPYLAKRYQLQQVAVVELPEDNLSPQDIQKTVGTVKQYQVKALFGEPNVDNQLLKTLSQDLKLTLQPLDSLESGTLDPQHYFTAMGQNLQTLQSAFQ